MTGNEQAEKLFARCIVTNDHGRSDYLGLIKEIVELKTSGVGEWQEQLDRTYTLLLMEIKEKKEKPSQAKR